MKKHQENDNTQLQYFRRIPVPPSHRQMQKKIPPLPRSPSSETAECSLPWWPWRAYRSCLTQSTAWCSAPWWRLCPRRCPLQWKYHSCRSWSIAVPLQQHNFTHNYLVRHTTWYMPAVVVVTTSVVAAVLPVLTISWNGELQLKTKVKSGKLNFFVVT